ncbi:hypothetical protein HDU91_006489 [Kappamyces sp. JEL0680]|nr:hypothetical protein HDU91_006489 [Kappamyces sp. JEL0680]
MAAGGLSSGYSPLETMIKECDEEAGIPYELAKKVVPVGCITFAQIRMAEHEWYVAVTADGSEPATDYCYDLRLDPQFQPIAKDGEVEEFQLVSIPRLMELLRDGSFKPEAFIVTLDFLIRYARWSHPQPRHH